jgi:hypothetical protein
MAGWEWRLVENGGNNVSICGGLGKRRERRKMKMGRFKNPPIFVSLAHTVSPAPPIFMGDVTPPTNI